METTRVYWGYIGIIAFRGLVLQVGVLGVWALRAVAFKVEC